MDLVEFLRVRLLDDQQTAEWAAEQVGDGRWQQRNVRIVAAADRDREVADYAIVECIDHIVRHDPARVLRDVDAKRKLMWRHQGDEDACADDGLPNPCPTLRLLALPYADHPSYRPEWRP